MGLISLCIRCLLFREAISFSPLRFFFICPLTSRNLALFWLFIDDGEILLNAKIVNWNFFGLLCVLNQNCKIICVMLFIF